MQFSCYHCGTSILDKELLEEELNGAQRAFCCVGCLSIAKMIHAQGLDIFYARRENKDFSAIRPDTQAEDTLQEFLVYDHPAMLEKYAPILPGESGYRRTTLRIENIQCAACVWLNEKHWRRLAGVKNVEINYISQRAVILYDPSQVQLSDLLIAAMQIGYNARPFELSQSSKIAQQEERKILFRLGVAMLGMMQVMMYAWPTYVNHQEIDANSLRLMGWAGWLLTVPVIFFSAAPMFKNAYQSILHFPKTTSLHMDVPISIALGLSWLVGSGHLFFNLGATYFDSITMFVALLLLARFIELRARHQTQNAVEALALQLPSTCNVVQEIDSQTPIIETIPLQVVKVGDILQVLSGEVIPVDGYVLRQPVTVSEAILTGESLAIEKQVGDRVYAGSYNLESTLYCQVNALGKQTKIAAIANLLEHALSQKPQFASVAEKWASYFVMGLLVLAVSTGIVWSLLGNDDSWERALAVLVVTCPCALSLAIPLALAASHGLFAKLGLVVIAPDGIEKLNHIDTVFLDKTGTVTLGELVVEKIILYQKEWSMQDILWVAKNLEEEQNHPIAKAIVQKAQQGIEQSLPISTIELNTAKQYVTGGGVVCGDWRIGSPSWLMSQLKGSLSVQEALLRVSPGSTPVGLCYQDSLVALFELRDVLRENAKEFIHFLKVIGKVPYLVSGDDEICVEHFAQELGITNYYSNCTPEKKLQLVKSFQAEGKNILALGDGVNDAPFLAMANVSIAMGQGAPLSQAGADFILFSPNFKTLQFAIIHAKNTQVIIRQNLVWGLTYNLVALPLAILGFVSPLGAAVGMSVSSILVSLNAARLGKRKS